MASSIFNRKKAASWLERNGMLTEENIATLEAEWNATTPSAASATPSAALATSRQDLSMLSDLQDSGAIRADLEPDPSLVDPSPAGTVTSLDAQGFGIDPADNFSAAPAVQVVDPAPAPDVRPRLSAFAPTVTSKVEQVGQVGQVGADPEVGQDIPPDVLLQRLEDSTNDPQVKKNLALLRNTHRVLARDGSDATQRNVAAMEDLEEAWARMESLVFDRTAWVAAFGTAGYIGGAVSGAFSTLGLGTAPGAIIGGGLGAAFGGQAYDAFVGMFFPELLNEEEIPDPMAASSTEASDVITDDMSEAPPASPVQPSLAMERELQQRAKLVGGGLYGRTHLSGSQERGLAEHLQRVINC